MLFNSLQFLAFFPLVTALYFLLPHRARWALLLGASCVFYMAFVPTYILILFFTILVDYLAAIWIDGARGARRKAYLLISIAANLGILAFFKYYNFLNDNLAALAHVLDWNYSLPALAIVLPIGLSFHIFQSLSYTIEVYRGNQAPERHLGSYALYVMFYPQLVAGPIERPQNLLHQFREHHAFDGVRVADGLRLMLWGLFMKVAVADTLAPLVNRVFDAPEAHTGLPLILGAVGFSFQIYGDFAGYSLVAIGAARVMGFTLMRNFDRPYRSASVSEFWTRWHISLSTWFKDYVYVPLGGNRVGKARWCLNLAVVFMLSGLWHGANWTFIAWGALHATFLIAAILTREVRAGVARASGLAGWPRLHRGLQVATTFALVTFAWIFFRAPTLADAWYMATHLTTGLGAQLASLSAFVAALEAVAPLPDLLFAALCVAVLEAVQATERTRAAAWFRHRRRWWVRWPAYQLAILVMVLFRSHGQQFIYFQF